MKTATRWYLLGLALLAIVAGIAFYVPALPYEVREVAFDNPKASVRLAGTLTLPRTPGPHPAIVLIPGSGEVDRDGSLFGHRFYRVLADDLTRRGFAVLRSDKRGLGESGGNFAAATSFDFASDIEAGLAFLRSRPEVDAGRIGLVGHSEGGLIGTMVAGRDPGIGFLVLMAANGIPAGDMFLARTRRQLTLQGKRDVEQELVLHRAIFAVAAAPGSGAERKAAVRRLAIAAGSGYAQRMEGGEFDHFLSPWMRTLLTIDPQPLLRGLHCPVLALVGEKDRVVTADENVPALQRALAGNPRAQVHRLPSLNHFFQTASSGEFSEVAGIEETISPRALDLIGSWALKASYRGTPNTCVQ